MKPKKASDSNIETHDMSEEKISAEERRQIVTQLVDQFHERIRKIDPFVTQVLKPHLIVEEEIDAVLKAAARNPSYLGNTRWFDQKVKWIRAFAPLGDDKHWELILAFNELRNKVAHKIDGPERQNALQKLRKQLDQFALIEKSVLNEEEWPDYNVILFTGMESTIFLTRVRNEIEKERAPY